MNWLLELLGLKRKKKRQPVATSPLPVSPTESLSAVRPLTMGVSVFCGWATPRPEFGAVPGVQCAEQFPWKAMQTRDRVPALGEYDERDPAVTEWRLAQMQRGKVDFACYQIEWAHEHTQPSMLPGMAKTGKTWRPRLDSPLINSHCADNHPPDSPVKFCVALWDVSAGTEMNLWNEMKGNGWTTVEAERSWRLFAQTIATRYMNRPNYLRIDDKPVLFRGYAENLEFYDRQFGLAPETIIKAIRDEVNQLTGKNLYLIATATDDSAWPKLKGWSFDALTHYALTADGWANAMGAYRHWWAKGLRFAKDSGLDYWIPTTVGYDSTAWGSPVKDRCVPTPTEFIAHLREARKVAADNYAQTRGMLIKYAWDEWGEGGASEPMQPGMLHDGDEMLRAHATACS